MAKYPDEKNDFWRCCTWCLLMDKEGCMAAPPPFFLPMLYLTSLPLPFMHSAKHRAALESFRFDQHYDMTEETPFGAVRLHKTHTNRTKTKQKSSG